jgi:hypothetical protein
LIDNLGGAIITGSMGDTLELGALTVNPEYGSNSALVVQFTPQGMATWADCISGNGRNFSNGAAIDRAGNLYLTGAFSNSFEKGSDALASFGDQDVFLAKYFNCATTQGEILGNSVVCPGLSTLLSIEPGYNHVIWNDTISDQNYILADKPGKYWVSMLDKHGCLLADTLSLERVEASAFSLGNDVSLPVENALLLKAPERYNHYRWQDNSDNATFLARAENEMPGVYTYWLSATDSLGCPVADTLTVLFYRAQGWEDPGKVMLTVYPNPVIDWLTWSLNAERPCPLIVELTDDNGKLVLNQDIPQYQPGVAMKIDFSDIPPGAYYFQLKNRIGQSTGSVCIIRQ